MARQKRKPTTRGARLDRLRAEPDGVIAQQSGPLGQVLVVKQGDEVFLVFCPAGQPITNDALSGVMSRIDLREPTVLKGLYTQVMICALAFVPRPKRAYVMGAGGGRIPMALQQIVTGITVTGSEIDANVLDLSRRYFGFANSKTMKIACADGRTHIATQPEARFDHIYLDCFGADGRVPHALSTAEFYALCADKLAPGGVICMNLLENDPDFDAQRDGFLQVFDDVWAFADNGTQVLFGRRAGRADAQDLAQQARALAAAHSLGFDLVAHVSALRPVPRPVLRILTPLRD